MADRAEGKMDSLASLNDVRTPPGGNSMADKRKKPKSRLSGNPINAPGASLIDQKAADSALDDSKSSSKFRKFRDSSIKLRKSRDRKKRKNTDFLDQAQQTQNPMFVRRKSRKEVASTKSQRAINKEQELRFSQDVEYRFDHGTPDGYPSDKNENSALSQDENDLRLHSNHQPIHEIDSNSEEDQLPSRTSFGSKDYGELDAERITQNLSRKPKLNFTKVNQQNKKRESPSLFDLESPRSGAVEDNDIASVSGEISGDERPKKRRTTYGRRSKSIPSYEDKTNFSSPNKKSPGISPQSFYNKATKSICELAGATKNVFRKKSTAKTSPPLVRRRSRRKKKGTSPNDSIIVLSSDDESARDDKLVDDFNMNDTDEYKFEADTTNFELSNDCSTFKVVPERRSTRVQQQKKFGGREMLGATRIAIGNKVFSHSCKLNYQPGGRSPYLQLEYKKSPSADIMRHKISFDEEAIVEIQYYIFDDESEMKSGSSGEDDISEDNSSKKNQDTEENVEMKDCVPSVMVDKLEVSTNNSNIEENDQQENADASCAEGVNAWNKKNGTHITDGINEDSGTEKKTTTQGTDDEGLQLQNYENRTILKDGNVNGEKATKVLSNCGKKNYLIMRIKPSVLNGLSQFSNSYLSEKKMPVGGEDISISIMKKRYVVVEIEDRQAFQSLIKKFGEDTTLRAYIATVTKLGVHKKDEYIQSLLDSYSEKKARPSALPRPRFKEDATLLVYPFQATDAELDSAAVGLIEASGKLPKESEVLIIDGTSAFSGDVNGGDESTLTSKTHMVTIRGEDFDRLAPYEFLNDTLIDFWMQWITRKLGLEQKLVHVFTTQFFSRLEDEGVDAITSWTAKKGVDIFEKKFIFIPVNKDTHWSLLVIVNPGKIQNRIDIDTLENIDDENEDVEFPFILFMDSLRLHKKKKLKLLIYKWLNSEAQRLGKFQDFVNKPLFCNVYMPVIDPKVPLQDNSCDCGVFVCRYAYGMMRLFDQRFACKPSVWTDSQVQRKLGKKWIGEVSEFDFNMNDISRMRNEMEKLILALSQIYRTKQDLKRQIKLKEKESKQKKFEHGKDTDILV